MDNKEAKAILQEQLSRYKSCSFVELLGLLEEGEHIEITAPSGKEYQVEIDAFWDDKPKGNLRVIGSIDDGWIRAYFPLSDDFLISPDGKLIDE